MMKEFLKIVKEQESIDEVEKTAEKNFGKAEFLKLLKTGMDKNYFHVVDGKIIITETGEKYIEGEYDEEDEEKHFDEGRFVPKRLGDEIMNDYIFKTTTDDEQIHLYTDGLYKPVGENLIKKEVDNRLGEKTNSHRRMETVNYIKVATYCEKSDFNSDKTIINLKNGLLHIDTMEFEKHSPKVLNTIRIPVSYDENAECPAVKKFLSEVLKEDEIPVVEEFFGYCLLNGYPIHKAFMLIGSGANGKSTLLNLLKTFLGQENITSISLQDLENNKFSTSYLYGKLANVYPDLSSKALSWSGKFKMLTGGDLIGAESKFGRHFDFENTAKMIFSTNQLPQTKDFTDAFFRRWVCLNFYSIFDETNRDEKLLEKLTINIELSGLFNLALSGLKRIQENGQFSYSKTTEEIREHYITSSSTIAAFCMDCLEQSSDDFVVKKDLFLVYCNYCRNGNLPIEPENTFHKNLIKSINIIDYQTKVDDKKVRTWKGIKFLPHMEQVNHVNSPLLTEFVNNNIESRERIGKKGDLPAPPVPIILKKDIPIDKVPNNICQNCEKPTTISIYPNGNRFNICFSCLKDNIRGRFKLLGQNSLHISEFSHIPEEIREKLKEGFWFKSKPDEVMLS